MKLRYLFEAEFEDGSIFKQNKKDVSSLDPKRSSFYDLLQDKRKIVKFSLIEQTLFKPKSIIVDLRTGEFSANNAENEDVIGEGDIKHPKLTEELRLIFYRQHQHDFNRETDKEIDHRITYCLGWQTTIEGKNYQQVLGIK